VQEFRLVEDVSIASVGEANVPMGVVPEVVVLILMPLVCSPILVVMIVSSSHVCV